MKKFLLVTLIGMVLTIDVFGVVKDFMNKNVEDENIIEKSATIVYVE